MIGGDLRRTRYLQSDIVTPRWTPIDRTGIPYGGCGGVSGFFGASLVAQRDYVGSFNSDMGKQHFRRRSFQDALERRCGAASKARPGLQKHTRKPRRHDDSMQNQIGRNGGNVEHWTQVQRSRKADKHDEKQNTGHRLEETASNARASHIQGQLPRRRFGHKRADEWLGACNLPNLGHVSLANNGLLLRWQSALWQGHQR